MAGRELLQHWTALDSLPPSENIYQGVSNDGGLSLRSSVVYKQRGRTYAVTERHLVALALTQACCDMGKGKVYYVPMPSQDQLDSMPTVENRDGLVSSFHRLPKLIYLAYTWEEEERVNWRAMKHSDRLALLNARGGALSRKDIVMPMDLVYDEIERKNIRFSGYAAENAGCMVILAIVPKAYVGWVTQYLKDYKRFEFSDQGFEDGMAWYVTDHKTLRENGCAMGDAEGLVTKLWEMYFAGKERALIEFEDLLKAMIDFHTAWLAVNNS